MALELEYLDEAVVDAPDLVAELYRVPESDQPGRVPIAHFGVVRMVRGSER